MDDSEDSLTYSDSILRESLIKQQDNEITISTMNNSSIDTIIPEDMENLSSNRHEKHFQFDYDQLSPVKQITIIKSEPCFKVTTTEDENTKLFYKNDTYQYTKQRKLSEPDSLEKTNEIKPFKKTEINETMLAVPHRRTSSPPIKSIIKKTENKIEEKFEKKMEEKPKRIIKSRSRSPSLSQKRQTSSERCDFNNIQFLTEMTNKQNASPTITYTRSLFDQTFNIFNPNYYRGETNKVRPSRFEFYIKPFRGESYLPTNKDQHRSRSLSQNRIKQQTKQKSYLTNIPDEQSRQSTRKQHVSWSPVRKSNYQPSHSKSRTKIQRKNPSVRKTGSNLPSLNSSVTFDNNSQQNSSSLISIPIRYNVSRSSQIPSPTSSKDSYFTPSTSDRYSSNYNLNKQENDLSTSNIPQILNQHNQTMQQYERLLQKMRSTDEQLQSYPKIQIDDKQQKISMKVDRKSSISLNKTTSNSRLFSPMILQICLIILVIFNLFVVYFFNEINLWWNEHISSTGIIQQHDQMTSDF